MTQHPTTALAALLLIAAVLLVVVAMAVSVGESALTRGW